jgi:hypothetical protein
MAALIFTAQVVARIWPKVDMRPVLMQFNAEAVCLVGRQFQLVKTKSPRKPCASACTLLVVVPNR